MSNFAEEITDWYFRLNGFFTLRNYVTHKSDTGLKNHSDLDLIGIRNPYVKEKIGMESIDDICPKLREIIAEISNKQIGIICEIKGGKYPPKTLKEKISAGVNRLGYREDSSAIIEYLETNTKYECDVFEIYKMYASDTEDIDNWTKISIGTMIEFIESRIDKYPEKVAGWNQYDSNIVQYIAYKNR